MKKYVRWLVPIICLAVGLFVLRLSYRAYFKWQELMALGDPSGAELYEIEFWPEMWVGTLFVFTSGLFVGRWSRISTDR